MCVCVCVCTVCMKDGECVGEWVKHVCVFLHKCMCLSVHMKNVEYVLASMHMHVACTFMCVCVCVCSVCV